MQKTKFTSHKQHLCFLSSRNVKRNIQTKVCCIFLVLSRKRSGSQTFKCSSNSTPFLQCIFYWYNLLRWMFFILCDNWKAYFYKSSWLLWGLFQLPCWYVLWKERFERGPCFTLATQCSNNTVLIPKFKNKSFYFLNFLN